MGSDVTEYDENKQPVIFMKVLLKFNVNFHKGEGRGARLKNVCFNLPCDFQPDNHISIERGSLGQSKLRFTNLQRSHAGSYVCVARSKAGEERVDVVLV